MNTKQNINTYPTKQIEQGDSTKQQKEIKTRNATKRYANNISPCNIFQWKHEQVNTTRIWLGVTLTWRDKLKVWFYMHQLCQISKRVGEFRVDDLIVVSHTRWYP